LLVQCGRFVVIGCPAPGFPDEYVRSVDPELADLVTHWLLNMKSRGERVRTREIVAAYDALDFFLGGGSSCSPFFEKLS
jgi:hypothetical protein